MMHFEPFDCSDRSKFKILQIQDGGGRHLENRKNSHISAAVRTISTKFGMMMQFNPIERLNRQKFEISKIQDGGGRHLEKFKIAITRPTFD